MIHPEQGMSRKVTLLTDFEYRVFEQTKLSSDDFGVMPYTSTILRAHNSRLRKASEKQVFDALRRMVVLALLLVFDDQDETFVCAPVWQTWQTIAFPRKTSYPKPPAKVLEQCDEATRELFTRHPGGKKPSKKNSAAIPESSRNPPRNDSVVIPDPIPVSFQKKTGTSDDVGPANAGAGAGANANANANANARESTRGAPLIVGPARFDRLQASNAFVGARLRIPHVFHEELRNKLGGQNPEAELRSWYQTVDAEVESTGETVPDIFKFLRPKFEVWAEERAAAAEFERFRPKGA